MNANAIQEKILSDARTGASDIMRDANEKAARLRDAAEKRMAAAHSRLMMQASEDAEAARLRMERMEELEERKRLLSDKRGLILPNRYPTLSEVTTRNMTSSHMHNIANRSPVTRP